MGIEGPVTCGACGHRFRLWSGGGFVSQVVFCEDCGQGTSLPHGRESLADRDPSASVGTCRRCDGHLRLDAPPCCPRCRSTALEHGEPDLCWD